LSLGGSWFEPIKINSFLLWLAFPVFQCIKERVQTISLKRHHYFPQAQFELPQGLAAMAVSGIGLGEIGAVSGAKAPRR
jgi:hypothetical protein